MSQGWQGWHENFELESRKHLDRFPEPPKKPEPLPCLCAAEGGCGWPNLCDNCKANATLAKGVSQ